MPEANLKFAELCENVLLVFQLKVAYVTDVLWLSCPKISCTAAMTPTVNL